MPDELDIREQLVRIDKALIESDRLRQLQSAEWEKLVSEKNKADAEHDKMRQEIWWHPIAIAISGMTAGAALLAAGAAMSALLVKFFGH
jgi:hypothetical protein